jgi:DNA-binding transcriptional ArsR family regulator
VVGSDGPDPLSEAEADELLRALAHPVRRELLRRCWAGPTPAGALSAAVNLAPASTSEHLKVLRKTGLLVMTRDGTFRRYHADRARLAAVARWLDGFPNPEEGAPDARPDRPL